MPHVQPFDLIVFGAAGFTGRLVAEAWNAAYGVIGWALPGATPRGQSPLKVTRPGRRPRREVALLIADAPGPVRAGAPGVGFRRSSSRRSATTYRRGSRRPARATRLRRPVPLDGPSASPTPPRAYRVADGVLDARLRLDPVRPRRRLPCRTRRDAARHAARPGQPGTRVLRALSRAALAAACSPPSRRCQSTRPRAHDGRPVRADAGIPRPGAARQ